VTEPSPAVFLSYASQDAVAAQRICEALRAAGVEVRFDQSELRGGDAWDHSIRDQINECALFVPIISANAHARPEGYFRFEWKLAVDRSHRMAPDQAFLLPVVVDDTPQTDKRIPDRFRELQWSRLPAGETPPAFVGRIQRLLSPDSPDGPDRAPRSGGLGSGAAKTARAPSRPAFSRSKSALIATIAVVVLAYVASWISKHPTSSPPTPRAAPAKVAQTAFAPPPHSIAVLPFVNMSGDAGQEYFSDGMTEELLNSLARINELQVAARTSAFSFKGKDTDIGTIARKLNVGAVLEGSVRRSGNTARITTQLINAVTGFHLWSQTYDRKLGDILALQTEIANAVAGALRVTLLDDVAARVELGGTHNAAAFDAYLRASRACSTSHDDNGLQTSIAAYTEAIQLDPKYALAFAGRSLALGEYAEQFATGEAVRESFALAPNLAEGHVAFAYFLESGSLDFEQANEEYERAVALAPGNATVLRVYSLSSVWMGRTDAGIAAARRAIVLDPLNSNSHEALGHALYYVHQYNEAIAALQDTLALEPDLPEVYVLRGRSYYMLGNLQRARTSCEIKPDYWTSRVCLAITYDKLGRHADAEKMLTRLKASMGDADAYQYAQIYAQWGNTAKALDWLNTAMRLRDSGLAELKTDPLLDPLRQEPRFEAIERELKFPH
jgi:TolB-like protein